MDETMLQDIKNQHIDNYKKALIETIMNNTKALVEDDVKPFFVKPPLDSMDLIRSKLISFAKRKQIVLDTILLDEILDSYRNDVIKCCEKIKKMRIDTLSNIVDKVDLVKNNEAITFYKKDFVSLNKKMKGIIKDQVTISIEKKLISRVNKMIPSDVSSDTIVDYTKDVTKYLKKQYQKQILDSFDIKVLIKDTTLMNSVKEQGEHYTFTMKNSRLLNDFE